MALAVIVHHSVHLKQEKAGVSKKLSSLNSGAGFPADKERARLTGAQGYLVKPVLEDELIAEVARLIAASKVAFRVAILPCSNSTW